MNNGIKVAISGSNSRFVVGPSARFQPNFSQSCDNTRRLEVALKTECRKKGAIVLFCGKSAVFETTKTADETRQNIFAISICFVSLSFFLVFPITIGIFIKVFCTHVFFPFGVTHLSRFLHVCIKFLARHRPSHRISEKRPRKITTFERSWGPPENRVTRARNRCGSEQVKRDQKGNKGRRRGQRGEGEGRATPLAV